MTQRLGIDSLNILGILVKKISSHDIIKVVKHICIYFIFRILESDFYSSKWTKGCFIYVASNEALRE